MNQGDDMPTLGEYAREIELLLREHGPLVSVEKWTPARGRHPAPIPVEAYVRTKPAVREGGPAFWHPEYDGESTKGPLVIRV